MDEGEIPMSAEEELLIDIVLAEANKAAERVFPRATDGKRKNVPGTNGRFGSAGTRPAWEGTALPLLEARGAAF
jgi:hypothetical protein